MGIPARLASRIFRSTPLARRASVVAAEAQVANLESVLDHERLYPLEWVHRRIRDEFGYEVRHGPFSGLRYPADLALRIEAYSAKLLGTYEHELHDAIEHLISTEPRGVVNIGASDGYYALGLARRLPSATVHAFDTNEEHHAMLRAVAAHNDVLDRVHVGGLCTPDDLRGLGDRLLVVCDCEGCELSVLDPALAPNLSSAALLVECHDLIDDRITSTLTARFASSHELQIIPTQPRWVMDHPELAFLPLVSRQLAIQEFREGPMHWMVATPRAN